MHGLRDRRRLGRAHRPARRRRLRVRRRRLVPDDELRPLLHRAHRRQGDRRSSATTAATPSSTGSRSGTATRRSTTCSTARASTSPPMRPRSAAWPRRRRHRRPGGRDRSRSGRRPDHGDRHRHAAAGLDAGRRFWEVGVPEVSDRAEIRDGPRARRRRPRRTAPRRMSDPFDLIAMGRVSVDIYPEQSGPHRRASAPSRKSIGGTATNVAVACARLRPPRRA